MIKAHPKDDIEVYATRTADSDDDGQQFCENIEKAMEMSDGGKKDRVVILMGDWNTKVGRGRISVTVGTFGLSGTNDRGERLMEFCEKDDLIICNTHLEENLSQSTIVIEMGLGRLRLCQVQIVDQIIDWY